MCVRVCLRPSGDALSTKWDAGREHQHDVLFFLPSRPTPVLLNRANTEMAWRPRVSLVHDTNRGRRRTRRRDLLVREPFESQSLVMEELEKGQTNHCSCPRKGSKGSRDSCRSGLLWNKILGIKPYKKNRRKLSKMIPDYRTTRRWIVCGYLNSYSSLYY
jgi:hypothetical protein